MTARPRAVVAAACLAPWGPAAAGLPGAAPVDLPNVPGFVTSRFNPLVAAVTEDCLGAGELVDGLGDRTGVVLATLCGDTTTIDVATQRLVAGVVHSPLLFIQSVITSILGHLTKRYGITGPISCVSARRDLGAETLRLADLMLLGAELDQVLVLGAELAANERVAWARERGAVGDLPDGGDAAVALLVRRPTPDSLVRPGPPPARYGWLSTLAAYCVSMSVTT